MSLVPLCRVLRHSFLEAFAFKTEEAQLEAKSQVKMTKIALEKWIGISLEEAERLFGLIGQ